METISYKEVAKRLHTSPAHVKAGVIEGKLPGMVVRTPGSTKDRIIIPADAYRKWEKTGFME